MMAWFLRCRYFIYSYLLQFSFFTDRVYYAHLWARYFNNFSGFILGAIAVVLIYFAGNEENIDYAIANFFRTLAIIAFLNSMGIVYDLIVGNPVTLLDYSNRAGVFDMVANPISGVIIAIIIFKCYKYIIGNAFCFGLLSYGIDLLVYDVFKNAPKELFIFLAIRAIAFGGVCVCMTLPSYFYNCWIIFSSFYLPFKVVCIYMPQLIQEHQHLTPGLIFSFDTLIKLLPDLLICAAVLFVSVIFERSVLTMKKPY